MLGLCLVAVFALSAVVAGTASAKKPSQIKEEEYKNFVQCPTEAEEAYDCLHSITRSGVFQVGSLKVKIKNPITLQGAIPNPLSGATHNLIPSKNGETLSKTPEPVPGGIGRVLKKTASNKALIQSCKGANAGSPECAVAGTAELAGTGEVYLFNFIGEQSPGVVLPIKLHLTGSILGENCYFGSDEEPVVIDFTTGATSPEPPAEPIHGSTGQLSENSEETILFDTNYEIVNNEFPAPAAHGCGNGEDEAEIDSLINEKLGLPSGDGQGNQLRLFGEQAIATVYQVDEHKEQVES